LALKVHGTAARAAEDLRSGYKELLEDISVSYIERSMRLAAQNARGTAAPENTLGAEEPVDGCPPDLPPTIGECSSPPLIVEYDDGQVWSDTHIPLHTPELMQRALSDMYRKRHRRLYVAGDFMDCQFASAFTSWGSAGPAEVREQHKAAEQILEAVLDVVNEIIIIPGNHDGTRFKHMSNGSMGFEMILRGLVGPAALRDGKIKFTEKRWCVLKGSPWGDWRLTHPGAMRKIPLSTASAIALKVGTNVLTGHEHHLAVGFEPTGRYMVCNAGHMQAEHLTDYKQDVDTTHASWTSGYVEFVDGVPQLRPYIPRTEVDRLCQRQEADQ
jgi:UDP-2,3-diacylglucosamine pyrophosphatase LpxH